MNKRTAKQAAEAWASEAREIAAWYALVTLQAIYYEGDMGARSNAYLYDSRWAVDNPERP